MLVILSPAKKLDFESENMRGTFSQPDLMTNVKILAGEAKKLSAQDLQNLMGISDNLAELNHRRYQVFSPPFTLGNARQAVFSFKGDAYLGLDADSLSEEDLAYGQDHFRILSGLYGSLRPLDLIQAYRLEMGTKFKNSRGKNLYTFWGGKVTKALNGVLAEQKEKVLINLASNEYYHVVQPKNIDGRIITPVFKEVKDGEARTLGVFAKKARGMMTRYILQNRIENPEDLKTFNDAGYKFDTTASDDDKWVFSRPQPAAAK